MPKDDDKTILKSGEDDSEGESSDEKKPSGSKKNLLLFGGIGLGAIVIGTALALFVVKPLLSSSDEADDAQDQTELVDNDKKKSSDHKTEAPKKKRPKKKARKKHKSDDGENQTVLFVIKDIVTNPAGTGGTRFLSVSFGFELESAEMVKVFEDREPIVRDILITILSSKTVAELTNTKHKEIIRYQIKKRVSKIMKTDELVGVYYTDFVLQ